MYLSFHLNMNTLIFLKKVNIKSSLYKYTLLEIVNYSSKAIIIKQIKNKEKETENEPQTILIKQMKGEGNKNKI